jgi:hypothetical protein
MRDGKRKGTRAARVALPVPVRIDSRICFGIAYFATEAEADLYAADVVRRGVTYNGGWFDGMACGRDRSWDYTDADGRRLYAVTE